MKFSSFKSALALAVLLQPALALLPSAHARAQSGLDQADQQALQQTTGLLTDRKQIEALTKTDKSAADADQQVKLLMGNEKDSADTYQLSADIFQSLAVKSGGDPAVMQKLLLEALKDPAAFANSFSPEQKAKLGELGGRVESRKPTAAPR